MCGTAVGVIQEEDKVDVVFDISGGEVDLEQRDEAAGSTAARLVMIAR